MLRMMKYPHFLPSSEKFRRRERGYTLTEILVVIAIIGLLVTIGYPMMRRSLVRAEMMGQVKMLQNAIAVCRMRAIKEGEWVVLELLKNESGTIWTAPGGKVFAWVDNNHNRRYNDASEELVGEWFLNTRTAILKEGADRRLFDLRLQYKGIVFLPSGVSIATKEGVPGIGRGSVIVEDSFGNQIRLQIWSSTATVQLMMKIPGTTDDWDANLRYWTTY